MGVGAVGLVNRGCLQTTQLLLAAAARCLLLASLISAAYQICFAILLILFLFFLRARSRRVEVLFSAFVDVITATIFTRPLAPLI